MFQLSSAMAGHFVGATVKMEEQISLLGASPLRRSALIRPAEVGEESLKPEQDRAHIDSKDGSKAEPDSMEEGS